ncbi:serine/threonine protein kinase [Agromyces sp. 3263]|uniref:protein kinase domain-containing protein n=1 Tax=Agromyces sp. 3263 TaxID=2817750 RepID=UPI00285F27F3|nr:S1 RNA-binding domain-containing protein [Agromyces sp. 3263]MDR6906423.1 serine/threonine protein kinase [Agromyces sp. 3263]
MSARYSTDDWTDQDETDDWVDEESPGINLPDEGKVVTGVVVNVGHEQILIDLGLGTLGRLPLREFPVEVGGKPGDTLSVGAEIEAVVLDSRYGSLPIVSVAMLQERLAWSEYPAGDGATGDAPDDRSTATGARRSRPSVPVRPHKSGPEAPHLQEDGEDVVPNAIEYRLLDPLEFLQPNRRLFIDTNVFMDTDTRRAGGLKRLFERGQSEILANGNPVVVPTKVVGELTKQSQIDPSGETAERAEAIRKAGAALTFLESASNVGLVRSDLGDDTNPYADDLFLKLFERFAGMYEMCLLTHDITIKLRIRLLAHRIGKRLVVGVLTRDGDLEIDSDESLLERGFRKYNRHATHIAEGTGHFKDESEVKVLKPLLVDFGKAFALNEPTVKLSPRAAKSPSPAPRRPTAASTPTNPFSARARLKPSDTPLDFSARPKQGDHVTWASADRSGSLMLGALLGEGGEGAVYEADRSTVVKIFDKDHLTRHRKEKIELLVSRNLRAKGLCIPSAVVRNSHGEFVGYVMPKASGREFQRTIFNKRKFEREFPSWRKADLVDICISFLEMVQYLHSMNVIVGDINPKNLMVDERKNVFVIDADSWQLEGYPCPVGTPMFTSPAMLGKTYSNDLRTMEDELFAVATMLFMIVMTGQFPYIRTGTDGDMVQLIKEGNFAFQYENRNNKDQPDGDWKYMWSHIHKPVKDLFWHTFHREGRRYKSRPTAGEWLEAFKAYKNYLGNKRMSFDPMSNDVYPIRNKAFKQDTPVQNCPTCARQNAIAGIWNDDTQEYFVPRQCNKCRDQQPGRAPVPCRDCGLTFPKSQLRYGRCPSCAQKEDERQARANMLDPSRLCARCQKPYITYGNVEWHQRNGRAVPITHKAGSGGRYPAGCVPTLPPTIRTGATASNPKPSAQPQVGFWARLRKWIAGS